MLLKFAFKQMDNFENAFEYSSKLYTVVAECKISYTNIFHYNFLTYLNTGKHIVIFIIFLYTSKISKAIIRNQIIIVSLKKHSST